MADGPLVSVAVPVRNGGDALARALDTVTGQTYANLEILIGDNGSTDGTEALCRSVAARDPRVRYIRRPSLVPVLENYRDLFAQSRGELFLWAAHDDLRSANYVETLVGAFAAQPSASLAASDFVEFDDPATALTSPVCAHDFTTEGLGLIGRLRKHTTIGCDHVYGLLKASYIREFTWREDVSWDVAFLAYMAVRGPFVYVPGATFYYHRPPTQTIDVRARETSYGRVRRFQTARTAWLTALAISDAHRRRGSWRPAATTFPIVAFYFFQGVRGLAAAAMPPALRSALARRMGTSRA